MPSASPAEKQQEHLCPPADGRSLVVILPALNEERTLGDVLDRIPRRIEGIEAIGAIVVDDGSTDRTAEIARQRGATVVSHRVNRGVGVSFRTGVAHALEAGADIIVNMDADGQFRPEDIPELIAPIITGQADMTTCSRFARPELIPEMSPVKLWGNRRMTNLVNRVCGGTSFTDVSCGFRAYRRETVMQMTLFGDFTYTQESFIDLVSKGMHIVEVPLQVRGRREFGKSRVASNLWNYAKRTSGIILRAARDVQPLRFFGGIGAALLGLGMLAGGFVFIWWLSTGHTSPYRGLITASTGFLILGFLLLILALIADMLGRHRRLIERILLTQQRMEQPTSLQIPPLPPADDAESAGESST
jgi:glycosyltransferase involved in cell wall biosynthesis